MFRNICLTLSASVLLSACVAGQGQPVGGAKQILAVANIANAAGQSIGKANLTRSGAGLALRVEAHGIAPGAHGIHLHMTGDCSATGFTTAGGHLNPAAHKHGLANPAGSHLGDLPNLEIGPDGLGALTVQLNGTAAVLLPALFDADGTAIIIHAAADDNNTDPSGNSGARIACGVLQRS